MKVTSNRPTTETKQNTTLFKYNIEDVESSVTRPTSRDQFMKIEKSDKTFNF